MSAQFRFQAKYLGHVDTMKEKGEFHIALNSLPKHLVVDRTFQDYRENSDYSQGREKDVVILVENESEYFSLQPVHGGDERVRGCRCVHGRCASCQMLTDHPAQCGSLSPRIVHGTT